MSTSQTSEIPWSSTATEVPLISTAAEVPPIYTIPWYTTQPAPPERFHTVSCDRHPDESYCIIDNSLTDIQSVVLYKWPCDTTLPPDSEGPEDLEGLESRVQYTKSRNNVYNPRRPLPWQEGGYPDLSEEETRQLRAMYPGVTLPRRALIATAVSWTYDKARAFSLAGADSGILVVSSRGVTYNLALQMVHLAKLPSGGEGMSTIAE